MTQIPLLRIYLKEPKTLIEKNITLPKFIAALHKITKIWKQPKCPSVGEWIKQLWDSGILLSHKKEENLPFVTVRMDLENIMLSEISLSEKNKYHVVSLMCGI